MTNKIFDKGEVTETLINEIVKRNFSNYKLKTESIGTAETQVFTGIVIRRSAFISCYVSYSDDEQAGEKYIVLQPWYIESNLLHIFLFVSYLLTGGLTLLLGYFVYRNFQAKFRDEIVSVLVKYLSNPHVEKNGKQKIIVIK